MTLKVLMLVLAACVASLAGAVDFGRIMALGDSLTGGAGVSPFNQYREVLNNTLVGNGDAKDFVGPLNGYNFESGLPDNQHAGFGGWGVKRLLTGFSDDGSTNLGHGKYSDWLTAYNPETVIFFAGGNDIWRWQGQVMSQGYTPTIQADLNSWFRGQYQTFLDESFGYDPALRVIWASYPKNENSNPAIRTALNTMYADMALLTQTMVGEQQGLGRNIQYVSLFENSSDVPGTYTYDGVHMNLAGSTHTAGQIYQAMMNPVPEPATVSSICALPLIAAKRRRRNR